MKEGKVKFFNSQKGFGFVIDNESQNEYFVHVTNIIDQIAEDDEVSFDVAEGKRGQMAVNVKVMD